MRVAILHHAVLPDAPPDESDVLVQVEAVADALHRLGHEPIPIACTLDLEELRVRLARERPGLAFNLVESLARHDSLIAVVPAFLEAFGPPYTGSPATAIVRTTHKTFAKETLAAAGLPTPPWVEADGRARADFDADAPVIIKTLTQHASFGLDDDAMFHPRSLDELRAEIAARAAQLGHPCFAERYINGRELNLSLLAGAAAPQVLPPAEIEFAAWPAERPRIVGYRAKWEEASFEYGHTPRRFDFPEEDADLLTRLSALARAAWGAFGLRGYARVDFRVDEEGRPWILEINVNPCLAPDAGFAAALEQAGIPFDAAVARILDDRPAGTRRK